MSNFQDFLANFHKFIEDQKLKEEERLSNLSTQKIAISGSFFIKKLLPTLNFNPCKGNFYPIISKQISWFNSIFTNNNIRYMLVFNGLCDGDCTTYKGNLKTVIRSMWKSIIKMDYDVSFTQIKSLYPLFYLNINLIFSILDDLNIEYLIAPYNESPQIRRLYINEYVNAIAVELDFLPFMQNVNNLSNIILDFDLENQKFFWVDCKKLTSKLQFPINNLTEFFLLAGILNNTPLFKIPPDTKENIFQLILTAEQQKKSISDMIEQDIMPLYHTQRKKMENSPILTHLVEVEIYSSKEFPEKMKEYFGAFLPLQIYLFFSQNLISKNLVYILSNSKIYTRIPVADSLELRSLIENEFAVYYRRILGVLTLNLSNYYKRQSYLLYKYYDLKDKPLTINNFGFNMPKLVPNLQVIKMIKENYNMNGLSLIHSIRVFISVIIPKKNNKNNTRSPNTSPEIISDNNKLKKEKEEQKNEENNNFIGNPTNLEEIACYSKLLFLHTLEYLNLDTKEITILGSGLRKSDELSEEYLIIILELMKSSVNHLYGKPICDAIKIRKISFESSPRLNTRMIDKSLLSEDKIKEEFNLNTFLNVLENERDYEKESLITCISRIFAFITPSMQYAKLKNVYDYDLSQYLSIVQEIQSLLNELYESILFNIFISCEKKEKNIGKIFFDDVKKKLNKSFKNYFNIDLAIAIKMVLQMKDSKDFESFCNNDDKVVAALKKDFGKGLQLWNEIICLLKYQENKGVFNQELNGIFIKADELLKNKLKELKIL